MATIQQIEQRLARRFANVALSDVQDTLADCFISLGYDYNAEVPATDVNRVLAYASAELATNISVDAARYFSYTDGEESVDKTMISEQYRKLALQFRADYEVEEAKLNASARSSFRSMKRLDRP